MKGCFLYLLAFLFLLEGIFGASQVKAADTDLNSALSKIETELRNQPENATPLVVALKRHEDEMNEKQLDKFHLLQASLFGYRGRYQEQIDFVNAHINGVRDINIKARFLYYLSEGYVNLGNYEQAILRLNDAIVLLPDLTSTNAKVGTLQSAITLFRSLKLYDDALSYADRLYSLNVDDNALAKCLGIVNRLGILFDARRGGQARQEEQSVHSLCGKANNRFAIQLVDIMLLEDDIESGRVDDGLKKANGLIKTFIQIDDTGDYVAQLYVNLAKAYLIKKDWKVAESYGLKAYSIAESRGYTEWIERASEVMAQIKRMQGDQAESAQYYEKALKAKDRLFNDQLQKNLAYQRVRFDVKDKENQLERLEQKNRELNLQQKLEREEKQNLLLIVGIIASALLALGIWLYRAIREKNRFQHDAQMDGLTQIINRTHFLKKAGQLRQKSGDHFSIVLFDMDNFKSVNDSFGHPAGDWVLRKVSQIVSGLLREGDIFGRFGGEEFAICLPSAGVNGALQFAERCRIAIAEIDSQDSGFHFPVTASFGIASTDHSGVIAFDQLIEVADKALYKSKAGGRNCVSIAAN